MGLSEKRPGSEEGEGNDVRWREDPRQITVGWMKRACMSNRFPTPPSLASSLARPRATGHAQSGTGNPL